MSDEPESELLQQLCEITTRLEELYTIDKNEVGEIKSQVANLSRRVTRLEQQANQSAPTTTTTRHRFPPKSEQQRTHRVPVATTTRRRAHLSRDQETPPNNTSVIPKTDPAINDGLPYIIGNHVYLLDNKKDSTPYGVVVGFTKLNWLKIRFESGHTVIRKPSNVTTNFTKK